MSTLALGACLLCDQNVYSQLVAKERARSSTRAAESRTSS